MTLENNQLLKSKTPVCSFPLCVNKTLNWDLTELISEQTYPLHNCFPDFYFCRLYAVIYTHTLYVCINIYVYNIFLFIYKNIQLIQKCYFYLLVNNLL